MNYENMTVKELVEARDKINAVLKAKRAEVKAEAVANAEARESAARANENLKAGATVSFMFDGEVVTGGKVLRTSEKSVTVESEVFAKGKGYRKYSEIVEVTAASEEVAE